MKICAVVLNWKDSRRTLRCVLSLASSDLISHVYVVDNESSAELGPLLIPALDSLPTTWSLIELPANCGFAAGVNTALAKALDAEFDAVLVINNDAVIDDTSVRAMAATLADQKDLGLVGPRITHPDGTEESAGGYLRPLAGMTSHETTRNREPDFITWACVLLRKEALQQVGLLDERFFMYWEDVDYSLRLKKAGWTITICDEAAAVHEVSSNKKSYPTAIKAYHTWSSIVFSRKHGGQWRLGNVVWLSISSGANIARLSRGGLTGLRLGIALAREGSTPAFESPKRLQWFGQPPS